jgi:aspartyl-tRNA(Asn)/glutamyl-tRNA(Gln) amidotransferase subunit A
MSVLPEGFRSWSVGELSRRLREKEFSSHELVRACAERVEAPGAAFTAISLRSDAISDAKLVDRELKAGRTRGALQGIPFGVSDLVSVANRPTAYGSKHFSTQVFAEDAACVERLQRARAIALAKLVTSELGSAEPGVAEAIASGALPLAIGVDSAGALVADCARRGVTVLAPTIGLVSRAGVAAVTWTLDRVSIAARAADDCGHALAAMAGDDGEDPLALGKSFRYAPQFTRPLAELSLAVLDDTSGLDKLGVRTLGTGWTDLPCQEMARVIGDAESASCWDDLAGTGHYELLADRHLAARLEAGASVRAVEYLRAMRIRRLVRDYFASLFVKADALCCRADGARGTSTLAGAALAGLPVLALAGPGAAGALLLVGKPLGENTLLKLGSAYESQVRAGAPPRY